MTLATLACGLMCTHVLCCYVPPMSLEHCALVLQCFTVFSSLYTSGFQCCTLPQHSGLLGVMGSCQTCQRLPWRPNGVLSPTPSLLPTQPNTAMAASACAKASPGCLTPCAVASLGSADSPLGLLTHMYLVGSSACPVYIPVHSGDWVLRLDHLVPYTS
jgi:hypothetical protein